LIFYVETEHVCSKYFMGNNCLWMNNLFKMCNWEIRFTDWTCI